MKPLATFLEVLYGTCICRNLLLPTVLSHYYVYVDIISDSWRTENLMLWCSLWSHWTPLCPRTWCWAPAPQEGEVLLKWLGTQANDFHSPKLSFPGILGRGVWTSPCQCSKKGLFLKGADWPRASAGVLLLHKITKVFLCWKVEEGFFLSFFFLPPFLSLWCTVWNSGLQVHQALPAEPSLPPFKREVSQARCLRAPICDSPAPENLRYEIGGFRCPCLNLCGTVSPLKPLEWPPLDCSYILKSLFIS